MKNRGFFGKIIGSIASSIVKRGITFEGGVESFFSYFGTLVTDSEEEVGVTKASRIDTVFSCINALAQDVSKLPFNVRQSTSKGRLTDKKHPVYNLIHNRPNQYTSAINFWYQAIFNMLSWGNSYVAIKRNKNYEVEQLALLNPWDVTCVIVEDELYYKVDNVMVKQEDMLHFKLFSFDGIVGVSPIMWNANTFGYRLKQNKYTAKVLGSKPEGILSFTEQLDSVQLEQNRKMWKEMTQGKNLGGVAALSGGAKYQAFTINPDDVQMIESANMSDERILGIFRVPPTVIQKYGDSAFKSPSQQDIVYLKYALTPIMRVIEQECDYKLFRESNKTADEPYYTTFNFKSMLRGSPSEQGAWYKMLITLGLASANDIREMEDMPPLPAEIGDMVVIQAGFAPKYQLKDFYAGKSAGQEGGEDQQRMLGYDIQALKDAIERTELMNQHEE